MHKGVLCIQSKYYRNLCVTESVGKVLCKCYLFTFENKLKRVAKLFAVCVFPALLTKDNKITVIMPQPDQNNIDATPISWWIDLLACFPQTAWQLLPLPAIHASHAAHTSKYSHLLALISAYLWCDFQKNSQHVDLKNKSFWHDNDSFSCISLDKLVLFVFCWSQRHFTASSYSHWYCSWRNFHTYEKFRTKSKNTLLCPIMVAIFVQVFSNSHIRGFWQVRVHAVIRILVIRKPTVSGLLKLLS